MFLPNKRFPYQAVCYFLFFIVAPLIFTKHVNAASFYINPATGQISSEKFSITLTIDPEGDNVGSASAYLSYDAKQVEVSVINNGTFNSYTSKFNDPTTGIIHIEAKNDQVLTGIVNFAVIEFTNLKTSPTIDLQLLTTPTYKSNILDSEGIDTTNTVKSASLDNSLYNSNGGALTSSATPSVAVPSTGFEIVDFRFLILLSVALSFTSLFMRSHAKSKY
ncbi:hypothetical protein GW755_01840 [bacterium]|nr:hypothetical protein [bacterium]